MLSLLLLNIGSATAQMPVTAHPHPPGYTFQQTRYKNDLCIDTASRVWVGFRDIGVGMYDGSAWTVYDSLINGIPSNNVLAVDNDGNNQVWIGTTLGAARFNGLGWNNYTTVNSGLPANKINSVLCASNEVWFGTDAGAAQFDGLNWTVFDVSGSGLINDTVWCMVQDAAGGVWFGTSRGVSRYYNNGWTSYDSLNSMMPSARVYDVESDPDGNTWIASTDKFRIDAAGQVNSVLDDLYMDELPLTLKAHDYCRDPAGRVQFLLSTNNYLMRFNNSAYEFMEMPPFNPGAWSAGVVLESDANNNMWMMFRYDAGSSTIYSFDINSYQPVEPDNWQYNTDNYRNLDINDVKALMLTGGDMHWDLTSSKYEVPKNSGKHSVYASAFWIGGMDASGQLHVAGQTYRQTGLDFWPGPISGISIPFDSVSCFSKFNKVWKVNKWEVEAFKHQFALGNVANGTYAIPRYILYWPARGNYFVTEDKAPFFDNNNDSLYNPYDGDYPLIKGDQMLFWMFNDSLANHTASDGPNMGVEVQASAYAYACPGIADSNAVLNTTTLYHYKILNRSQHDYANVYLGLWCDTDLGYVTDDYIGCDTTLASGFTYNGDNFDDGIGGYGLNPPMQNVTILNGPLADPGDGLDNDLDGTVDESGERTTMNHFHTFYGFGIYEIPQSDQDFYKYLRSFWLDSTHVTYGGWAGSGGTIPTNFIFSGTPYDTGWTEINVGNPAEDRRFLLSSGPVSLPAGGTLELDFAYVFTRDSLNPNGLTTSIARNRADVQRVHSWFDNDNFPSCLQYVTGLEIVSPIQEPRLIIYPNPAAEWITIDWTSLTEDEKSAYRIMNTAGQTVRTGILSSAPSQFRINGLPAGVYTFLLYNKGGFRQARFVKME
jgi:hypothetical protein